MGKFTKILSRSYILACAGGQADHEQFQSWSLKPPGPNPSWLASPQTSSDWRMNTGRLESRRCFPGIKQKRLICGVRSIALFVDGLFSSCCCISLIGCVLVLKAGRNQGRRIGDCLLDNNWRIGCLMVICSRPLTSSLVSHAVKNFDKEIGPHVRRWAYYHLLRSDRGFEVCFQGKPSGYISAFLFRSIRPSYESCSYDSQPGSRL